LRLLGPLGCRGPVRGPCGRSAYRPHGPLQRPERGPKMVMNFADQPAAAVSAIVLLVDYLLGVACGMFGGLVFGSVRENYKMSLLEQAPDPLSAGARALLRPFARDDDGYLRSLPPGRRHGVTSSPRGADSAGSQGQGVDR